jgi:hypothetical protein
MFRMYNHVPEESEIRGWGVVTEKSKTRSDRKHHNVCLSGVEKGIRLALDRNKYEDLTVVDAGKVFPNINTFTKLYSIYLGGDRHLPIITSAETPEENRNILLFNYETNPGEVIADIEFNNLTPISHYITNKDFKSRLTLAAIDIDNTKDFGVKIKYGFNGGRILQIEEIRFTNYFSVIESIKSNKGSVQPIEFFSIDNSHETVEKIESTRLNITRMSLSNICINQQ